MVSTMFLQKCTITKRASGPCLICSETSLEYVHVVEAAAGALVLYCGSHCPCHASAKNTPPFFSGG